MASTVAPTNRNVLADYVLGARVRDVSLVLAGAGLTGVAAQVSIHTPLSPVPFTLQTVVILIVGAALGPLRGALSMSAYAVAGEVGLPWFANQTHRIGGPAFGYIVGLIAAAASTGALAKRGADRRIASAVAILVLGEVVVHAAGTAWLAHDLTLGLSAAFSLGIRPFLATDTVKVGMAVIALPAA